MSRMSRTKGKTGELEIVHMIQDAGWKQARRTHDGREQALRGDIANGPQTIHFEVKRTEKTQIWSWWEQAEHDHAETDTPVVVFRRSRSPWLAVIEFDELLALLKLREE